MCIQGLSSVIEGTLQYMPILAGNQVFKSEPTLYMYAGLCDGSVANDISHNMKLFGLQF